MIEWEVLEKEQLPKEAAEPEPPRRPLPWKGILLAVVALVVVIAGSVAWRMRTVERLLRDDLQQVVVREERAIRLGVAEEAALFVDPRTPDGWRAWYRSIFTPTELPLPAPVVENVENHGERVLVMVEYDLDGKVWRNARAYRLVDGQWKRTPISDGLWYARDEHASDFFTLEMSEEDRELVPPEALARTLGAFRDAWGAAWPIESSLPITITFSHNETLTEPRFDGQQVFIRSPLVSPAPLFDAPDACSLGIIEALARMYSGELNASGEDLYLRTVMRQAVVEEITRDTDGLCQVVGQAEAMPPPSALGLPSNFAHYLVKVGGAGAAYTFVATAGANLNLDLDTAAQQATGHPFAVLRYGAERYPLNGNATYIGAAAVPGAIGYGQIVGRFEDPAQGIRIADSRGGERQVVVYDGVAASCLSDGDVIVFEWMDGTVARHTRLLRDTVTPLPAALMPATTRLVYQREALGNTYVYARTAEDETFEVLHLAESVQIVPHPARQVLAWLSRDGCGWVLNEYTGTQSLVRRWAVPVEPDRVIWVENQPAVVAQREDEWGRAYWQVYMIPQREMSGTLRLAAANRGRLLGYSTAHPGFLVSDDHALHWSAGGAGQTPAIGGPLATLPYRFQENSEFSALSHDGRWLAFNIYPVDGRSDLNVLDTQEFQQRYVNTIPVTSAGGETRWSVVGPRTVAQIVGDLGLSRNSGMSVHMYQFIGEGIGYDGRVYRANGEVDQLRWCSLNQQVTFRETNDSGARIMIWDGQRASPLTDYDEADRVLWCP